MRHSKHRRFGLAVIAFAATAFGLKADENTTVPGAVTTPHPTLINLAVEWAIEGDANRDGVVSVAYRIAGSDRAEDWNDAMPLRRVSAGQSSGTDPIFEWANKHSGSIFDLQPDTEYEIRLSLADPDGGSASQTVRAKTRPVPSDRNATIIELPAGEHGVLTPNSGTREQPVVYRSTNRDAVYTQVDMRDCEWVTLDGVTVRNTDERGFGVRLDGAKNCAVTNCVVEAVYGIVARRPGATDCYVADNVVTGVSRWVSVAMGADGENIGEGIQMTGPGNVICYNRVTGFRDCISTMEDRGVVDQFCIDIYGNDIYVGSDDGIEADFCMHNVRVMRNRLTNCFVGLSSQPGLGGPTYFIRNAMYNLTLVPYKFHRGSVGDVVLHNTVVKVGDGMACFSGAPFDYALFRNNLAIGGPPGGRWGNYHPGRGRAAMIQATGDHCDFDYDAVGTVSEEGIGQINRVDFLNVEPHGIIVGMDVFDGVAFPYEPVPGYEPPDLRPRDGSAVVDAGVRLANVNDGFLGDAPDIGAYEAGQPLPHYGPRTSAEQ